MMIILSDGARFEFLRKQTEPVNESNHGKDFNDIVHGTFCTQRGGGGFIRSKFLPNAFWSETIEHMTKHEYLYATCP